MGGASSRYLVEKLLAETQNRTLDENLEAFRQITNGVPLPYTAVLQSLEQLQTKNAFGSYEIMVQVALCPKGNHYGFTSKEDLGFTSTLVGHVNNAILETIKPNIKTINDLMRIKTTKSQRLVAMLTLEFNILCRDWFDNDGCCNPDNDPDVDVILLLLLFWILKLLKKLNWKIKAIQTFGKFGESAELKKFILSDLENALYSNIFHPAVIPRSYEGCQWESFEALNANQQRALNAYILHLLEGNPFVLSGIVQKNMLTLAYKTFQDRYPFDLFKSKSFDEMMTNTVSIKNAKRSFMIKQWDSRFQTQHFDMDAQKDIVSGTNFQKIFNHYFSHWKKVPVTSSKSLRETVSALTVKSYFN